MACVFLLLAVPCTGMELGGVMVQESILTDDGAKLQLNGAGIREKFFFDIYVAALYLEQPGTGPQAVIVPEARKRVMMHFLYSKVDREKLVDAWNEGFEDNLSAEKRAPLQQRIDQFNAMFEDAVKGDIILLDYTPGQGTRVVINSTDKGIVPGKDFNDALLSIWLGDEPVTSDLKEALLKGKK